MFSGAVDVPTGALVHLRCFVPLLDKVFGKDTDRSVEVHCLSRQRGLKKSVCIRDCAYIT